MFPTVCRVVLALTALAEVMQHVANSNFELLRDVLLDGELPLLLKLVVNLVVMLYRCQTRAPACEANILQYAMRTL
jgi:hypothetical protein